MTVRIPYTRSNGTRGLITLPSETIKPGRMVQFDTQKIVRRVQQEQIAVASLEVKYNTAPGSIIVAAQSVSADYNQVFRVLINDPLALPNASGGYPWRIEDTSTTYVYIKNVADYEEDYVAFLVWEGDGMYTIGMNPIAAHETINIDVK